MPAPIDLPEPKTAWEWITTGVLALLAVFGAIAQWLRTRNHSADLSIQTRPAPPTQLDRMEADIQAVKEDVRTLCKTLTSQGEEGGFPVATSKLFAVQILRKLEAIEQRWFGGDDEPRRKKRTI